MAESQEEKPRTEESDWLNNLIAVSVAILAAFSAVTKVTDDNVVQAMLRAKSDALDGWSQYQSKSIKQNLVELSVNQTIALRTSASGSAATQLDTLLKNYKLEIERYKKEKTELAEKARAFEESYDSLNSRDDQFDLSDAALAVSLAMMAVTALTRKLWLLWASYVFGAFGFIMGLAGMMSLPIHLAWLVKLLS